MRCVERHKSVRKQAVIVDPNNSERAILKGLDSIKRGDFIELKNHEELQAFFSDIITRGKKRCAFPSRAR